MDADIQAYLRPDERLRLEEMMVEKRNAQRERKRIADKARMRMLRAKAKEQANG